MLDDEHVPATFLPWDTSGTVRRFLGLPVTDRADRQVLAAWVRLEPLLADTDHLTRTASLALQLPPTARAFATAARAPAVRPRFRRWHTPGNVIGNALSPVYAVAAFTAPDGRSLLATGDGDGSVLVWDPLAVLSVGPPLTGHQGLVLAVTALTALGGRPLVVTGGDGHTVRIWDVTTGTQLRQIVVDATVTALAAIPQTAGSPGGLIIGGTAGFVCCDIDLVAS